jgi:signal transduction histidine kinase
LHVAALGLLLALLALLVGRPLAMAETGAARRSWWLAGGLAGWGAIAVLAFQAGVWLEVVPVVGLLASCFVAGLFAERTALLTSRNALLGRYAADLASEAQRQRERIEGELHDSLQQMLVVLGREIRQVLRHVGPGETRERVELMRELTEAAQAEVKRLRADLLPPALRYGRLVDALPTLLSETGARSGLETRLEVESWEPLPSEQEVELYWLVKEALNNVEKHALASRVTVRLRRDFREAVIEVVDDGRGFEPPDLRVPPAGVDHSGLHRMWLRMQGHRGDLRVASAPGAGTTLRLVMAADAWRPVK